MESRMKAEVVKDNKFLATYQPQVDETAPLNLSKTFKKRQELFQHRHGLDSTLPATPSLEQLRTLNLRPSVLQELESGLLCLSCLHFLPSLTSHNGIQFHSLSPFSLQKW